MPEKESSGPSGAGIPGGCELSDMSAGDWVEVVRTSTTLLNSETPFQPHDLNL